MGDLIIIGESKFERIRQERCPHTYLTYDAENEEVYCKDCNRAVNPFTAFMIVVNNWQKNQEILSAQKQEIETLHKKYEAGILKATLKVDKAWRSKNMVPTCPHCGIVILPEDGLGNTMLHREYAAQQRRFKEKK